MEYNSKQYTDGSIVIKERKTNGFHRKESSGCGTGVSGIAAAELLLNKKIDTVLFDANRSLDVDALYEKAPALKGVPLITGELSGEQLSGIDVAVLSPGVPCDLPFVEEMRRQGIVIWGEIELAYHFGKGRVVAITGTNGKTTTTALTGAILESFLRMCALSATSVFPTPRRRRI